MTLAEQLQRARAQLDMDPRQVAAKAGVSEEDVLRLEAGDGDMRLDSLLKLARALCGRIEFVPDHVLRIIDDVVEGDS